MIVLSTRQWIRDFSSEAWGRIALTHMMPCRPALEVMELTGHRPLPRASEGTQEAIATRREVEVDAMSRGVA
jgi:hypothetical protein